ncbi:MAG: hypothetical protein KKF58_00560 [Gammaproteobacteria bacterium]|nr:hypothetical protein [Gammaproteobacteria bacterium]MBU1446778.1 hypothetical protein [Gammaproteobacteria bacterium]
MRALFVILAMSLAHASHAQSDRCRFIEQIVLMQSGLAEGQACHESYRACLARPFVQNDPIPKTRCIETIRCGARFWVPTPSGVSNVSNLGIFKQECEPE